MLNCRDFFAEEIEGFSRARVREPKPTTVTVGDFDCLFDIPIDSFGPPIYLGHFATPMSFEVNKPLSEIIQNVSNLLNEQGIDNTFTGCDHTWRIREYARIDICIYVIPGKINSFIIDMRRIEGFRDIFLNLFNGIKGVLVD